MNTLFPILSAVLLATAAAGLAFQLTLCSKLRRQHPRLWERLEESSCGFMTFERFLWLKRYRTLGNEQIARRAARLRGFWKAFFALFLLVVALACLCLTGK